MGTPTRAEILGAGSLDRKISIEQQGPAQDDGMRTKPGGWVKICDRFAALLPLSGAEIIAGGEKAAFRTQRFRIRRPRSFAIDPASCRLVYGNVIYDITEVQEVSRDQLDLIANARADNPPEGIEA